MQKKIIAVAVAGLSTAAFAQTNVTIYGVADVSGQGYTMSGSKAQNYSASSGEAAAGSVFSMQSNSSLIGFKGSEDLGNGLKAIFQAETTLNLTGGNTTADGVRVSGTQGSVFGAARDSYIGLNSKYGTVLGGFVSTPYRSSLTSFDVMPGATGAGTIEKIMGSMRFTTQALNGTTTTNGYQFDSSLRATAIAYAMPTLYGFDGSIAYTGSNNNGTTNTIGTQPSIDSTTAASMPPIGAFAFNLGWTGYGVNVKGAFSQTKYNVTGNSDIGNANAYTSYLVGASYTGIPGLKVSAVYNRNSLGTNANGNADASKLSNNQFWTGASYRMGNWEPRVSAVWNSDISGAEGDLGQLGSRQWTANVGYYLSKRTQVYGLVSNLNNSANQNYTLGLQANRLAPTGGQNLFTYGMGVRTTF